jgi:hypothetical protein
MVKLGATRINVLTGGMEECRVHKGTQHISQSANHIQAWELVLGNS